MNLSFILHSVSVKVNLHFTKKYSLNRIMDDLNTCIQVEGSKLALYSLLFDSLQDIGHRSQLSLTLSSMSSPWFPAIEYSDI